MFTNMHTRNRRILLGASLTSLIAWVTLLPGDVAAQESPDRAVAVKRTEHQSGNGTNPITRTGNILWVRPPFRTGADDIGFAFWFKRDLAADQITGDAQRTGAFIGLLQDAGSGGRTYNLVDSRLLPDDSDWHFYYLAIDAPSNPSTNRTVSYSLYIDGAAEPAFSSTFEAVTDYQSGFVDLTIGGERNGVLYGPSSVNGLVDDLIVWDSIGPEVSQQVEDIASFGISKLDAANDSLVYYQDCNDLLSLPYWFEGAVVRGTKMTDIANNHYRGWIYDDGLSAPSEGTLAAPALTPQLVDAPELRQKNVLITVNSEFASGLSPAVGRNVRQLDLSGGSTVRFSAPQYIYLDRFRNEIGHSDQPEPPDDLVGRAFYRARNLGYAIETGGSVESQGTDRFFSRILDEPIAVTWRWELDYALYLESNTADLEEVDANSLGAPTIDHQPARIGLHWLPGGTSVQAGIDAIIDDQAAGASLPARYETRGYTIDNQPGGDDYGLYFGGGDSRVDVGTVDLPAPADFSIEFWARRERRETTQAEILLSLNESSAMPVPAIHTGFYPSSDESLDLNNAMFLQVGTTTFHVPGPLTDAQWHHWAWTFDATTSTLLCFRDGEQVGSFQTTAFDGLPKITSANMGNTVDGGAGEEPYQGTLNNVRYWTKTLGQGEIRNAMETSSFGEGTAELGMEFDFDEPNLKEIESSEGNAWLGILEGFDYWGDNRVLVIDGNDELFDPEPPLSLVTDGYTLEARVNFPLPLNEGGSNHLFHSVAGTTIVSFGGELGSFQNSTQEQLRTGYSLDHLRGWHMLSAVANDGQTTFYVDGQEVGVVDAMVPPAAHLSTGPVHRYSFAGSGTSLTDSVSGANGSIIEVGPNNATQSGGKLTLEGGARGLADYPSFPPKIISQAAANGATGDLTVEIWGTNLSAQNWGRVFSFGSSPTNVMLLAWTQSANPVNTQFAFYTDEQRKFSNFQPNAIATESYWVLVVDDDGGSGGKTRLSVYLDGRRVSFIDTDFSLADFNDPNIWLGRSEFAADSTANAEYEEFRIYDYALTEKQIQENAKAGVDLIQVPQAFTSVGNNGSFPRQPMGMVDEVRIWDIARRVEDIRADVGADLTGAESKLTALWNFDAGSVNFDSQIVQDVTTNGNDGTFSGGASVQTMSTDLPIEQQLAAIFPTFELRVTTPGSVPGGRLHTRPYLVSDWMRVTWEWTRTLQVKLVSSPPEYADHLYVKAGDQLFQGQDAAEVWVDEGTDVVIGARYRSTDRCSTLSGLTGQTNAFSVVTMDTIGDGIAPSGGAAAREYRFPALEGPGSLIFSFGATRYRVALPLGESLDGTSTAALSAQLSPPLCAGALIEVGVEPTPLGFEARGQGGSGDGNEWDEVFDQLFPVRPGSYSLGWPDIAPGVSHPIDLEVGFPNTTITAGWYVEDDAGFRLDDDGNRIIDSGNAPTQQVAIPAVSDQFPGSPDAHYPFVFRSGDGAGIPVDLDLDKEDRWYFDPNNGAPFQGDGTVVDPAGRMTATADGKSVLVYSYRPDADETATGDRGREGVVVRVVESTRVEDHTVTGSSLASGEFRELVSSSATGLYARSSFDGQAYGFGYDQPRTLEFWMRLDDEVADPTSDRLAVEIATLSKLKTTRFGVRGTTHATNPGGLFYSIAETSTGQPIQNLELTGVVMDTGWHHVAISVDTTDQQVFLDGNLIGTMGQRYPDKVDTSNTQSYGYSMQEDGLWLEGAIDNLRIWKSGFTASSARGAMQNWYADASDHWFAVSFDKAASGKIVPKDGGAATGDVAVLRASEDTPADASLVVELQEDDGPSEVASLLDSKLDTAKLGGGFSVNEISNYNANLYDRSAPVGGWGPLYPVNWGGLFTGPRELIVAYYQNPSLTEADTTSFHPNVAWPYVAVGYSHVTFPEVGRSKDRRIYISSRLGTEGVDANGSDQLVFDPNIYSSVILYNQPDRAGAAGFNPNEEHALLAPSIKDQLTGDGAFDLGQDTAFALQNEINVTDTSDPTNYTSDPWVLMELQDAATGAWEMAAYKVETTRAGGGDRTSDLFPQLDPETHRPVDGDGDPVSQPDDPMYDFDYAVLAGDVYLPPYPVNLVVGNQAMGSNVGGNVEVNEMQQRTLWNDKNGIAWVVSGAGRFFYANYYPLRDSFWFDLDGDGSNDRPAGTEIAWLAPGANPDDITSFLSPSEAMRARYSSFWRDDYPILKRGETATYSGGEHLVDDPTAEGLPAIVAMASAEAVFDSRTPTMVFEEGEEDGEGGLNSYSARVVRPLDRRQSESTVPLEVMGEAGLTPDNLEHVQVDGSRWYFKDLVGSLQRRVYYDALANELVFRGRLNDLEGGSPDITKAPINLYVLEPNVLTAEDYETLKKLPVAAGAQESPNEWEDAVGEIYTQSQNPSEIEGLTPATTPEQSPIYWSGVQEPFDDGIDQFSFFSETVSNTVPGSSFTADESIGDTDYQNLVSLGTGAALVPNPTLLSEVAEVPLYVTIVENNHPDVGGAIALHVIEIGESRFRGGIKLVEAQNAFDEKVNLRHTADFGGNTKEAYYEWWAHDSAPLDTVGTPDGTGNDGWQRIEAGLGLNQVDFVGRPDLMISDKLFFVRYGEEEELSEATDEAGSDLNNDPAMGVVNPASWRKVAFQLDSYDKELPDERVPFQWAGAANSPQLQADGSRREIPQLVMGWVKRVLDRINPYEARYTDFSNNESPAVYSSMVQIAGAPFNGKVALNADKDVVEGVGLIQLYETILLRAKELTLDEAGATTEGTNQALLLAATRLATLYELLAREAYSDAQNPTILVTPENGLATAAPFVHAFYNQEADLLSEELALLRGTDFVKSYPSYNRLFWNYVKGLGEAAYNANYRIADTDGNGFIDEFDAAALFPQGHGDAWGHFLSASRMHYDLLTDGNQAFVWEPKSELYGLLDNVIEVDYLDEKSFARIAAAKARAGKEIVAATYRDAYTQDPDGQWQGYQDADPARAWGVAEWGARAGQAALFDWMVANSLVPAEAEDGEEGLERIDRIANRHEIGEVAATYTAIQSTIDLADNGGNPLGFDSQALTFDLDPLELDGNAVVRDTHFDQIYKRAVAAAGNGVAALDFASGADQQLQRLSDDTYTLQVDALSQDVDYRNRLIEIFGTPYEGNIGPGQVYPEGYVGPDTIFYQYIDYLETEDYIPSSDPRYRKVKVEVERGISPNYALNYYITTDFIQAGKVDDLYSDYFLSQDFGTVGLAGSGADGILEVETPVLEASDYAFQAPEAWGNRGSSGRIQVLLNDLVSAQLDLERALAGYDDYVRDVILTKNRLDTEIDLQRKKLANRAVFQTILNTSSQVLTISEFVVTELNTKAEAAWRDGLSLREYLPLVEGLSNDLTSAARGAELTTANFFALGNEEILDRAENAAKATELLKELAEDLHELDEATFEAFGELLEAVEHMGDILKGEEAARLPIGSALQRVHAVARDLRSVEHEGFRLLEERGGFHAILAAKAQRNRYSDMALRLTRNDALQKYQSAYNHALRYAWLAAKAYEYETSLDPGDPASATTILEEIVRTRQLGNWTGGEPRTGNGGLAEILAQMKANFDVLEGQLGLNNPQREVGQLSLRTGHFKISPASKSDSSWRSALANAREPDLWDIPEFREFCRPFADPADGPQPGFVLEFATDITPGYNAFGKTLAAGDSSFSAANFATKVRSVGVSFEGYDNVTSLAASPRVYLVPVGTDRIRVSTAALPAIRDWDIVEQRIPTPFVLNETQLRDPNFIPAIDTVSGILNDVRRHGDFRAYGSATAPESLASTSSRLIGRSVWNTRWLLVIPGAALGADPSAALDAFTGSALSGGVTDIHLEFETYSNEGN